ncbi:MAG: alanyl-tRNA editing protein [Candidatus Thorarchaeota archaeon]|nr:MAG: alanyl-tRNA editing protein [Candidatus Thorarchaeota archaeon]
MTDLLYMRNNYLRDFDAKVIRIDEDFVVLDRTAFYPLGGGQTSDKGFLNDEASRIAIHEVRKVEGEIRHFTSDHITFASVANVHGELDWAHRYECMRFHTAQHVLSRYLQLNYGVETVGNIITPGKSRADYAPLDDFGNEMKAEVEAGVNALLTQNLEVETRFMERKEAIKFLKDKDYQTRYLEMVPESVREFRVLIVGDYDASSCAGTHVSNTSEVGTIAIGKSTNVGAGKRRIYFRLWDEPHQLAANSF